jgi:hypothetical protein
MVRSRYSKPLISAAQKPSGMRAGNTPRDTAVPRWPGTVSPPGYGDFERSAKMWLFELAPSRWRYEEILHRCPAGLALLVKELLTAQALAMREGQITAAARGGGPEQAQIISEICLRESYWAEAMLGQVSLVEEELRARNTTMGGFSEGLQ